MKLNEADISRIIEMAWEDRTPFEAIESIYGLKEKEVIKLMRSSMKESSFKMWRKRVSGRETKHLKKFPRRELRFVSPNQKKSRH